MLSFLLDVLLGVFSVFQRRTDKGPGVVVHHRHRFHRHRTGVVFFFWSLCSRGGVVLTGELRFERPCLTS